MPLSILVLVVSGFLFSAIGPGVLALRKEGEAAVTPPHLAGRRRVAAGCG